MRIACCLYRQKFLYYLVHSLRVHQGCLPSVFLLAPLSLTLAGFGLLTASAPTSMPAAAGVNIMRSGSSSTSSIIFRAVAGLLGDSAFSCLRMHNHPFHACMHRTQLDAGLQVAGDIGMPQYQALLQLPVW